MNTKEQAQQISQAIQETQAKLHALEVDRYWFYSKRDQINRLKRVLRALDRDLKKLVATIPAPVQYDFFSRIEDQGKLPFDGKSEGQADPMNQSVQADSTLTGKG